jgi:hypothetical protein
MIRRYLDWASSMPHIHFYAFGDCVPIPCPYWVDRFIGPDGFWRFSFDS